jgi:DNA polymerase (family 10)
MAHNKLDASVAAHIAEVFKSQILYKGRRCKTIVAGGIRRRKDVVKDIDMLVICKAVPDIITGEVDIVQWIMDGERHSQIIGVYKNVRATIDIFYVRKEEAPYALYHYTGSRIYNIRIRSHAKALGFKLNQYGIFRGDRKAYGTKNIKTEKDIADYLGVSYKHPWERNE